MTLSDSEAPDTPLPATPPMPRRRFLRWLSGIGAAVSAVIVATPSLAAFFSPAVKKPTPKSWTKVANDVNALDVGVPIKVDFVEPVNDAWVETRALRTVWLYTEDLEHFTAYSGVCTHLGCSFGFDEDKKRFHCPCHHGLFDMKTGAVIGGPPPRPLDSLPVKVENGEVHVQYRSYRTGIPEKVET